MTSILLVWVMESKSHTRTQKNIMVTADFVKNALAAKDCGLLKIHASEDVGVLLGIYHL